MKTTKTPKPKIGDTMPDGTKYAGRSPDTHKPMYVTPKDAPLTMKWQQAMDYASDLNAHGHDDWQAPTKGELHVLFKNRAAIGSFDETGLDPAGFYWTSVSAGEFFSWDKRFSDGIRGWGGDDAQSSLRCVRS